MALPSDGSYGIPAGIFYGVPVLCEAGKVKRLENLQIDAFARERLDLAVKELMDERKAVEGLLG